MLIIWSERPENSHIKKNIDISYFYLSKLDCYFRSSHATNNLKMCHPKLTQFSGKSLLMNNIPLWNVAE